MGDAKDSPLVRAFAEFAIELVQDEIKSRCERLEDEPLGHVLRDLKERHAKLQAEGRKANKDDIAKFFGDLPDILKAARAQHRGE